MSTRTSSTHDVTVEKRAGYLELLRGNVDFRRLWLGNVVSLLGDWFNFIALVYLLDQETGSPLAVGLVFIAKMLPWALASPFAGVIVDRFNRRRLMIVTDVLRALAVLGLVFVDEDTIYLAYVLTALQMVVGSVFQPARTSSIPNVTTPRELYTANALMAATWSTMLAIGAGLGGFAAAWLGPRPVFVLDSLTYLLSAWFIWRAVIPQDTEPADDPLFATALHKIAEGWQHLRTHPRIGRIALAKATWAMAGGALVYMLTLLGEEVMMPGLQAAGIGLLFLARGVGTGIGPLVARRYATDEMRWPALLGLCIMASGLFYGALGYLPWTLWIALFVVAAHAFSGAQWVLATLMLQKRTVDRYRGRVFATEWLFVMLADSLSILTASLLLEYGVLDLRSAFQIFALAQVAFGVSWLLTVVPRERAAHASGGMEEWRREPAKEGSGD